MVGNEIFSFHKECVGQFSVISLSVLGRNIHAHILTANTVSIDVFQDFRIIPSF